MMTNPNLTKLKKTLVTTLTNIKSQKDTDWWPTQQFDLKSHELSLKQFSSYFQNLAVKKSQVGEADQGNFY